MKIRKRQPLDEVHRRPVLFFRFARKSGDDIRANRGVRQSFVDDFDSPGIMRSAVPPVHRVKNAVRPRLQRHVKMRRDSFR